MNDEQHMDKRVLGGAGWMLLVKFSIRGIGMLSILILARLLVPEDFGLVAMASSIIALVELLRAFSFDIVLIQRTDASDAHFNTVWTLKIIFGLLMAVLLYSIAGPASEFYKEERLTPIIEILALSVLVGSFENIGIVNFRKEFDFRSEFNFMLLRKLFGFFVTIPLAFWWRSYWALVAGMLATSVGSVITSYLMHSYRPKLSLVTAREILSFSVWMQINNILFFSRGRSIDFIVGRIVGSQGLGVLTLASEISSMLTSEAVQPINRALFPGYAKLEGSMQSIRRAYVNVVGGIALVVLPIGAGLSVVARDIVPIVLGTEWTSAIAPIQILAIYSALVALQGNNVTVYLALGRPRLVTALAALSVAIAVPMLIGMTYYFGLLGACFGLLATVLLMAPVNLTVIRKVLGLKMTSLSKVVWRPVMGSLAMVLVCRLIQEEWLADTSAEQIIRLIATTTAGAIVYSGVVGALWHWIGRPDGAEDFVYERVLRRNREQH